MSKWRYVRDVLVLAAATAVVYYSLGCNTPSEAQVTRPCPEPFAVTLRLRELEKVQTAMKAGYDQWLYWGNQKWQCKTRSIEGSLVTVETPDGKFIRAYGNWVISQKKEK